MKTRAIVLGTVLAAMLGAGSVFAHCQIPCGIYTDELRFNLIDEHIRTVEKSMQQIEDLSAKDGAYSANQLARWVGNKETHAQEIQDIVHEYFLTQRVKPVQSNGEGYQDYLESLRLCHEMLFYAMKSKQTVDEDNVKKLREAAAAYREHYFKDKEHDHE